MNASQAIAKADKLTAAELKSVWAAAEVRIAEASARLADINPDAGGNPLIGAAFGPIMRQTMETGTASDVAKLRAEAAALTDELAMLNAQTMKLMELHTRAEQVESVQGLPDLFAAFERSLEAVTRAQEAFTQAWADSDAAIMDIRHARGLAKQGGLQAPVPDAAILESVQIVRNGPKIEGNYIAAWNVSMGEIGDSLGLTAAVLRDIRTKAAQAEAKQEPATA